MTCRKAVKAAPSPVNGAYHVGKLALEPGHRKHVTCTGPRRLTGSIFLDSALAKEPKHADKPRWDYGLGYKPTARGPERAVWIEVHPATTGEVSAVLKKLRWLRDWLNGDAEQLMRMTNATAEDIRFVWIASAGVNIPRNSPPKLDD